MDPFLPTTTTADELARGARIAVLPIGSFEQHGDYLPLITDTAIACVLSRAIADNYPVLLLPPITISCSHEHSEWSGTVSISARTLYSMVSDIYESVTRSGPSALVIVNGHGGNYVLSNVVQEGSATGKRIGLFPAKGDWDAARAYARLTTSMHEDMHAGESETSILLYSNPDLVRDGYQNTDHIADDRRHLLTVGLRGYTDNGIIGRPSLATAEKGKMILDSLIENFAALLELFNQDVSGGRG